MDPPARKSIPSTVDLKNNAARIKTPSAKRPVSASSIVAKMTSAMSSWSSAQLLRSKRSVVSCWWHAHWHYWYCKTPEKKHATKIPVFPNFQCLTRLISLFNYFLIYLISRFVNSLHKLIKSRDTAQNDSQTSIVCCVNFST